jgi:hypothetical protein
LIKPDWRKLWVLSLILTGLFAFSYGWEQNSKNPWPPATKITEPPEVKLLRKGRYEEAARAILDSIKDEKKDSWRYQSVAAVYFARAENDRPNQEKWYEEANRYIDKSAALSADDPVNLMSAAFGLERIGDFSSRPCPYYEKATKYAEEAMSQLKADSIFVGDEKMPTQPVRDEIEKHLKDLESKNRAKCAQGNNRRR